jgi:cytochrome c5
MFPFPFKIGLALYHHPREVGQPRGADSVAWGSIMSRSVGRLAAVVCATALAAGCAKPAQNQPPSPEAIARAASLKPADPRLAGLYASACHACHGQPGSGAPLAGDRDAWDPRWDKGLPALMTSVVGGYKGMPAGGQCFACNSDDYRALIQFMAGREGTGG